jgi:hypothetical protein
MDHPRRTVYRQEFWPFALTVPVANAVPLSQSFQQANLQAGYDGFIISNPSKASGGSGNSVLLGDQNVNTALFNGLEILPGAPIMLSIHNERPLYEVQAPLIDSICVAPEKIPLIAWDVANIWLRAFTGDTIVGVIIFKNALL